MHETKVPDQVDSGQITRAQWLALTAAILGWMFDGAEMGVFSMVGRAAMRDLFNYPNPTAAQENEVGAAFSIIIAVFLIGAAAGGVLFGWLGDRIGRVRAMSLSVLVYALFTGLCGFVQSPLQLGALRFVASLGMGGEWALGVALVMEVWPNRSRALMAGLIGAASNVGFMLVGIVSMGLNSTLAFFEATLNSAGLSHETIEVLTANSGWRLMMMLGALPAVLTFFFRIFVPESHRWEHGQQQGHTQGWKTLDLLGVVVGCLGPALILYVWLPNGTIAWRLIGTPIGLAVAIVGFSYPVVRYLTRQFESASTISVNKGTILRRMGLGACLSGIALLGTWGTTQWSMSWAAKLVQNANLSDPNWLERFPAQWTQIFVAVGAIIGTLIAAWLGEVLGRRITYALMCILSMASVLWLYQLHNHFGLPLLTAAFVAGACTSSFYGWLPLYLPELFPTRVRATCQGFGFNFGRILAAIGTLQLGAVLAKFDGFRTFAGEVGSYPVACSFLTVIYLVGLALICVAPETKGTELPE